MLESNVPNNPVISQKQAIIDLFAEFYGEEFRDKISKNMDNTIILFADNQSYNGEYFTKKVAEESSHWWKEFYPNLCEAMGLPIDPELLAKDSFKDFSNIVDDLAKLSEKFNEEGKVPDDNELIISFLSRITNKTNGENSHEIDTSKFDMQGINVKELIEKAVKFFDKDKQDKYEVIKAFNGVDLAYVYDKKEEEFRKQFRAKCYDALYDNLLRSFNKKISRRDANYLKTSLYIYFDLLTKDKNDEDFPNKGDLQRLFDKIYSIFVEDDGKYHKYEEFINNKDFMSKVLSQELLSQIAKYAQERDDLISKNQNNPFAFIDQTNAPIDKTDTKLSVAEFIAGDGSFGSVINDYSSDISVCLLSSIDRLSTPTALHELGHIATFSTFSNGEFMKSGLLICQRDPQKSENRYLEEVINEYSTDKITKLARRRGISIGANKDEKSNYTLIYPYISDFLDEFLPELNKCRISNDPSLAYKIFGEDLRVLSTAVDKFFGTEVSNRPYREQCALLKKGQNENLTNEEEEFRDCIKTIKDSIKNIRNYVYQNDNEIDM